MKKHASIFGDLTAEEIKAKLQARREAEKSQEKAPETTEAETNL